MNEISSGEMPPMACSDGFDDLLSEITFELMTEFAIGRGREIDSDLIMELKKILK